MKPKKPFCFDRRQKTEDRRQKTEDRISVKNYVLSIILSTIVIVLPITLAASCTPNNKEGLSSVANVTEVINSTAEDGDNSSEVLIGMEEADSETNDTYSSTPEVSIQLDSSSSRGIGSGEARRLYYELKGISSKDIDPSMQVKGDSEIVNKSDTALNTYEQAVFDSVVDRIFEQSEYTNEVVDEHVLSMIDSKELTSLITTKLDEISSETGSRSVGSSYEDLTEEEITQAVQHAMDQYSTVLSNDALGAAVIQNTMATEDVEYILNSTTGLDDVQEAMEDWMAETDPTDGSRSVNNNCHRETTKDLFIKYIEGNSTSGDILYVYSPGLGTLITGHSALWGKNFRDNIIEGDRGWLTADTTDGSKSSGRTSVFTTEHQISGKDDLTQMRMTGVNSYKTETQRMEQLNTNYDKYNGRGYSLNLIKSNDSNKLYCSQVCWLTWDDMGKNIDGAAGATRFLYDNIIRKVLTVTLNIGWFRVTFRIVVFYVVTTLITYDMVAPWDIVIDNDTYEYLRWDD